MAATPSVISCQITASVIAGVADFPLFATGVSLGLGFLLRLSAFAMVAACASRMAATPSVISCQITASVIAGVADVDVHLGGIYQHIHANIE
nr:hypothetical protein [Tanacetum cinerariifolium]